MTVQYKAKVITKTGGAGSGPLNTDENGPSKTILMGYTIVAKVLFQAIGE